MKDRIKKIMEKEGFTPVSFADYLGVNRQTIIATFGRNKTVSTPIITAVLEKYEDINPEWLLLGKGTMYKGDKAFLQPDLFENLTKNTTEEPVEQKYPQDLLVQPPKIQRQSAINQLNKAQKEDFKKIDRIIVFYSDNTFATYNTSE